MKAGLIPAPTGFRKLAGYGLLAVCALAWLAVFIVPFLGLGLGRGAAIVTALIIVGEGAFVIGVALLGKDILNVGKALIARLRQELGR